MKNITLVLVGLSLFSVAFADDDGPLPATRPTVSTNAEVVPFHMSILETGATYRRQGTSLNLSGIEGELRVGFAQDWEFDVFIPNYTSGSAPRGWNDGGFQLVRQLPGFGGWHVVLSAGASVPSGQSSLTAGAINPTAFLSADHGLTKDLSLTETFYVVWQHVGGSYFPSYANALSITKDLGNNLGAFVELNTTMAPGTTTGEGLNIGYTFAHNASQQVDFHFGRNFVAGSDTYWFVGFGYSQKLSK